ncbi:hypothetical protein YQE_07657, partial [Dendroctonus ponderosae]
MLGFLVFCAAAFTVTPAVAEKHLTWFQAFEACERRGLELASIHSQSEEDAIELVLGNSNNRVGNGFWVSATSLGSSFVWFTSGSELIYKNFAGGQPDNPKTEKCLELFRLTNGTWKWNSFRCGVELSYICQTKPNCCYFN